MVARTSAAVLPLLLAPWLPRPGAAQQVRSAAPRHVAVLLDGPSAFNDSLRAAFVREINDFFGAERPVDFPPALTLAADWTPAGVAAAIDRLLADPGADLVLALGPIGSNDLAHRRSLPKPAIASLIIDATLQDVPNRAGASGVRNLTYVNVAYSGARTLALFHDIVPFRRLAVLVHPGLLAAVPALRERAASVASSLSATITMVGVTGSAADALRALPADADAAYLTPLEQLPATGLDSLISGLTVRRLPTFSYAGRGEVERGALAAYAPKDDVARRARRVAGNIRRILDGEDAGTLPVDLASVSYLTLNMATARAIGFSPGWATLTEAELLNAEPVAAGLVWSLGRAAQEAVRVNLDLEAARRAVASGAEDVQRARSALLPQLQAGATGTLIREETAATSLGQQAERTVQGVVSFSQTLIDDQTWASYRIAGHEQTAREADRRRAELDVVLDATTAYLRLLQARAIARVDRENLRVTRSNLEVAQLREHTGAATVADVYRWESELATGRKRVIDADALVHVAALDLNRVLNRPLEEPFQAEDARVDDPELLTSVPGLRDYFANPETFAVFRDFMVVEGQAASPELRALDAAIAAERRAATAAGRAFWLPSVALQGNVSDVLSRDGAGSEPPPGGLPPPADHTWSLRLQAVLPLFTGFARTAARSQATIEVERLTIERAALARAVAQRVRATLHQAAATWADIEQTRAAADAALRNLDLVSDAYGRGAVSIVTLLDAQQAALLAGLSAANGVYAFLLDLMTVERAVGEFSFFRTADDRRSFVERLEAFYRQAGVSPVRR